MSDIDYAAQWQKKIEDKSVSTERTVEMQFGPLKGVFRRISLAGWAKAGQLPFFILEALQKAGKDPTLTAEQIQGDFIAETDFRKGVEFQRKVVIAVCVKPEVVDTDGELAPGQVRYADLAKEYPEVIDLIVAWALAGSPEIPVSMFNGQEVGLSEVETFRNRKQRRTNSAIGRKVSNVRKKPSRDIRVG